MEQNEASVPHQICSSLPVQEHGTSNHYRVSQIINIMLNKWNNSIWGCGMNKGCHGTKNRTPDLDLNPLPHATNSQVH